MAAEVMVTADEAITAEIGVNEEVTAVVTLEESITVTLEVYGGAPIGGAVKSGTVTYLGEAEKNG